MELLEGYLYLHLDLGSGAVKIRASDQLLNDGDWHSVEVIRNMKAATVSVDEKLKSFTSPGKDMSYRYYVVLLYVPDRKRP